MNTNSNPHPRTPGLNAIVKAYNKECQQIRNDRGVVDRGLDTGAKFGTESELQTTVNLLLSTCTLVSMRTRMDLLLSKYMMLRSEDRRHAELADIFAIEASKEGIHSDVKMLCLKLHSGKVFVIAIVFDFFLYICLFFTLIVDK